MNERNGDLECGMKVKGVGRWRGKEMMRMRRMSGDGEDDG